MQAYYTRFEAADLTGTHRDRFREWADRGYITPSIQQARGRGTKNLYSYSDLYLIRVFRHLVEVLGARRETAARCVAALREHVSAVMEKPFTILSMDGSGRLRLWLAPLTAEQRDGCDVVIMLNNDRFIGEIGS